MGPLAVFGITNDGLNLAVNLLLLFLVVLWLALVYWTYADARRRIEDPLLVGCATAASLFPFVGTIVYTIVRPPEYLEDMRERELEIAAAEARLAGAENLSCPYCAQAIEGSFLRCPNCLHRLKEPCSTCGKPLDPRWQICPYCEAEVGARPPPAAGAPAPATCRRPSAAAPAGPFGLPPGAPRPSDASRPRSEPRRPRPHPAHRGRRPRRSPSSRPPPQAGRWRTPRSSPPASSRPPQRASGPTAQRASASGPPSPRASAARAAASVPRDSARGPDGRPVPHTHRLKGARWTGR